jgi:hypothetical protein
MEDEKRMNTPEGRKRGERERLKCENLRNDIVLLCLHSRLPELCK